MCDCFEIKCKCEKKYIPIHIADFGWPRKVIEEVYCPKCIPPFELDEWETISEILEETPLTPEVKTFKFAIREYLIELKSTKTNKKLYFKADATTKRKTIKPKGFAIKFRTKRGEYFNKTLAKHFYDEHVEFNGSAFDDDLK